MNKKLVVMIRVRMEVEKNIKKCCVDKDLDTDVGADIALDYQHKIVRGRCGHILGLRKG